MEHGPGGYMAEFNAKLAAKRTNDFVDFLNSANEPKNLINRGLRRQQLQKMIIAKDLNYDDIQSIFVARGIDQKNIEGLRPKELAEILLPKIDGEPEDEDEIDEKDKANYSIRYIDKTITPTDGKSNGIKRINGETQFVEKQTIERTDMLVELLDENGISSERFEVIAGKNDPNMMRRDSYALLLIPSLETMILVCDEEGNATFVIHDFPADPEDYYGLTKAQLKAHPLVEEPIRWSSPEKWKFQMLEALTNPDPKFSDDNKEKLDMDIVMNTLLKKNERTGFLSFHDFVREVRASGINTFLNYKQQYNKHRNWPAGPDSFYAKKGWVSWLDLFGKEAKVFLSYEQFVEEVKACGIVAYKKYRLEYKKHKDWPSEPENSYANTGWVSWPHLFGKEAKEYLNYLQFFEEVRACGIDSHDQYNQEYKKHKNWPASPNTFYANTGWVSWPDLIGKETKSFLSYEQFVEEVKACGINSRERYNQEYKKHKNWPANPSSSYVNKGWVSWLNLFGREAMELLSYEQLVEEVRDCGIGSQENYYREYKKHKNWPSKPQRSYAKAGWVSWPHLYGKDVKELLSYEQFIEEVNVCRIESHDRYKQEYLKHKNWPSHPDRLYANSGWVSWPHLFGKETKKYLDFERFIQEVRVCGVRSFKGYNQEYKKHQDWPASPNTFYAGKGWISWIDLFGKT